eukprot:2518134-Rhodomonas_salina.1
MSLTHCFLSRWAAPRPAKPGTDCSCRGGADFGDFGKRVGVGAGWRTVPVEAGGSYTEAGAISRLRPMRLFLHDLVSRPSLPSSLSRVPPLTPPLSFLSHSPVLLASAPQPLRSCILPSLASSRHE